MDYVASSHMLFVEFKQFHLKLNQGIVDLDELFFFFKMWPVTAICHGVKLFAGQP